MPKIYCNDDYRDNVSIELSRSLSLSFTLKLNYVMFFLHLSNIYKRLLLYMNCVKEKNSK